MTTLIAARGQYHIIGQDGSLLIPWGGDAVFDWLVPESEVAVSMSAIVEGVLTAPQTTMSWE